MIKALVERQYPKEKLAKSRGERFPTIEIIPLDFKEEIDELSSPAEAIRYIVRVPLYIVDKCLVKEERWYADVNYSEEYGVTNCKVEGAII